MNTNVVDHDGQVAALRHPVDWLLGLFLLATFPLVTFFCCDLWQRSDYRFFPLLILATLLTSAWRGQRQLASDTRRKTFALGLWSLAGLCAVASSLFFSPWLATLALSLAWTAWMLVRFGQIPWPRILKWALPLLALLLLPLSDQTDLLSWFASTVTYTSSHLLDLLGIRNFAGEQSIQWRSGSYDVAAVCRGLGNPYLLFTLSVLLCISTSCSLSQGLITSLSAPLWSWGGAILLVVGSIWLAENQKISLPAVPQLWMLQAVALATALAGVWLLKWSLETLLAPFVAYSEGINTFHKFYNRLVLWPKPDPLESHRKRKRTSKKTASPENQSASWLIRYRDYLFNGVATLAVLAGAINLYQIFSKNIHHSSWMELTNHSNYTQLALADRVSQQDLPELFFGLQLIDYDVYATPGTANGEAWTARWTYASDHQTIVLKATAPYRGSMVAEHQRILDGAVIVAPPVAVEVQLNDEPTPTVASGKEASSEELGAVEQVPAAPPSTCLIRELTLQDKLAGQSYVSYITWPIENEHSQTSVPIGQSQNQHLPARGFMDQGWMNAIAYQPTSACMSLELAGNTPASETDKDKLRQMLVNAMTRLQKIMRPH